MRPPPWQAACLKFSAFPDLEGNTIEARLLLLQQGTPLKRTEAVIEQLTSALDRMNATTRKNEEGEKSLIKNVTILFNENMLMPAEQGRHVATLRIDLIDSETRNTPQ